MVTKEDMGVSFFKSQAGELKLTKRKTEAEKDYILTYEKISNNLNFYAFAILIKLKELNLYISNDDLLSYFKLENELTSQHSNFFQFKASIKNNHLNISGIIWSISNPTIILKEIYEMIKFELLIGKGEVYNQNINTIREGIKKMGFKNTKENGEAQKLTFLYAINDNGNDCSKEWSTFPVLVCITKEIFELKIIFAIYSKPGYFSNVKLNQVYDFIQNVNKQLKGFSFHYDIKRKHTYLKTSQYLLNPPLRNLKMPQRVTSEAVHIYTSFGYGLFSIFSSKELPERKEYEEENKKLLKMCLKRRNKPIVKFSLIAKEILNITNYSQIDTISINKEKTIIDIIKTNPVLADIFLTDKISLVKFDSRRSITTNEINFQREKGINSDSPFESIKYPSLLYKRNARPLKDFFEFSEVDESTDYSKINNIHSEALEILLKMIDNLSLCGLMIHKALFRDCFVEYNRKVYCNFKYHLQEIFREDPYQLLYQEIQGCLQESILNSINYNPWYSEDAYFSVASSQKIALEMNNKCEFNRYGVDLKCEWVADKNKIIKLKEQKNNLKFKGKNWKKIIEIINELVDIKKITSERYHLNQFWKNDNIVRYLGLLDDFTIISEAFVDETSFESQAGLLFSDIQDANTIGKNILIAFCSFNYYFKSKDYQMLYLLPKKCYYLKDKNKILMHIIPESEFKMKDNLDEIQIYINKNQLKQYWSSTRIFYLYSRLILLLLGGKELKYSKRILHESFPELYYQLMEFQNEGKIPVDLQSIKKIEKISYKW